jgi:hypothetical protein
VAAGMSITCPSCGMTSWNENDVREGYCGNCHDWTQSPLLAIPLTHTWPADPAERSLAIRKHIDELVPVVWPDDEEPAV